MFRGMKVKILGMLVAGFMILNLMSAAVYAVADQGTNINCLGNLGAGGFIYDQNGSTPLPVGRVIQVIDSVNNASEDPNADGTPSDASEVVLATIAVGENTATAGTIYLYLNATAHNEDHYIYLRSWNANTIASATHYGDSELKLIDHGSPPSPINWDVANFTVNISRSDAPPVGDDPSISSVVPGSAYIGQTIVISGSNFGADKSSSTITIGGTPAYPTAWSDTSITLAVPTGVASGAATVVITTSGGLDSDTLTVIGGGVIIDDVEGGCVGTWALDNFGTTDPDSGYYTYGTGVEPSTDTISTDGPQNAAVMHGTRGMRLRYSYTSDWGGGWGGALAKPLDLSAYSTISLYVRWDGSSNNIKFAVGDSAGHSYFAAIPNSTLAALGSYGLVTINKASFAEDVDNTDRTAGAISWSTIASYNVSYPTTGTTTNYQYIDSIYAGTVDWGTGPTPSPVASGEVTITSVTPSSAPAGTIISIEGSEFGLAQGLSLLVFENNTTRKTYPVEIIGWNNTTIEAIVPRLATAGNYTIRVIKQAIAAGGIQAYQSNPEAFEVTSIMSNSGIAVVYPNPFNPLATALTASDREADKTTIAFNATAVQNVGVYIYDMTARLVYQQVTSGSQVSWSGVDNQGNYVADGLYLIRVVNEDTKAIIAKGRVLVIKRQ